MAVGRYWGAPPRPSCTIESNMTSIHRTLWAPVDTMTTVVFDGKEGVIGSNPMEGSSENASK